MHEINKGDKVCSTWTLSNNPFATPKVVNEVIGTTVYAGGVIYHTDDLVLIEQRPNPEAKAMRRPLYVATHDLAQDCVIALDELLCGDDVDVEDIPPWLITTGSMVIDF